MASSLDNDIKAITRRVAITIDHDGGAKAGSKAMFAAHFACHMRGIPKYYEEEARCHYCQIRSISLNLKYPITIFNEVDNDGLPETFQFVDRVVPNASIPLTDEAFITSCECDPELADSPCVTHNCSCLADIDHGKLPGLKKNAYHRDGKLRGVYLNGRFPIYECGPKCMCDGRCPNRVVQKGRTVALEIFKTENGRGWGKVSSQISQSHFTNLVTGVKAKQPIKTGHFVDCYYGELLTAEEAQARRDEAESAQQKDVYLFALDKFTNPDAADERLHVPYEIDGEFMSGPTRFINHSCDPNLRIYAVVKHLADQPFHSLAFFAIKDIAKDTELTFDYLDGLSADTDDEEDDDKDSSKEKRKCLCGANKCRGYLF